MSPTVPAATTSSRRRARSLRCIRSRDLADERQGTLRPHLPNAIAGRLCRLFGLQRWKAAGNGGLSSKWKHGELPLIW